MNDIQLPVDQISPQQISKQDMLERLVTYQTSVREATSFCQYRYQLRNPHRPQEALNNSIISYAKFLPSIKWQIQFSNGWNKYFSK